VRGAGAFSVIDGVNTVRVAGAMAADVALSGVVVGVHEKRRDQVLGGVAGIILAGGVGGFAPIARVKSGIPMFFRPSSRSDCRSSAIVGCGAPPGGMIGSV
jgi:hypothetical protein